ncbi:hypothetical protein BJV78DRAFT_1154837 [Lactifluus subvellereus]|nr:hypothetical protein BJV78DRAFT_1154837 [Lactifluus subvellereus]
MTRIVTPRLHSLQISFFNQGYSVHPVVGEVIFAYNHVKVNLHHTQIPTISSSWESLAEWEIDRSCLWHRYATNFRLSRPSLKSSTSVLAILIGNQLGISRELRSLIVPALQELTGERAMEVLPALDRLYLEEYQPFGSDRQAIEPFIAARQYSDHPVTVRRWERSAESESEGIGRVGLESVNKGRVRVGLTS